MADFLGVSNLMDAVCEGSGVVRIGDFTLRAGCGELGCRGPVKVVARPDSTTYAQGTPVAVHVPSDALRVLAPSAGAPPAAGELADEPDTRRSPPGSRE